MTRPRVLVLADVPGWAWDRKALAYRQHLGGDFDVTVAYHATTPPLHQFDLVHLFEVSQVGVVSSYAQPLPFKVVAGLTAHVWRTWGAERMAGWAAQVDALHGNSLLLYHELRQFHDRVYYTPNGVDADFWRRINPRLRGTDVVLGHVGKPNPRKGAALIIEAARKVGVELRLIQRTAKVAYSAAVMRGWYQGVHVQVTASNMDGTPNPMLEAAACECALLSTPIGNMPEFINRETGFLTRTTLPYHGPEPVDAETAVADARQMDQLRDELAERMLWFKSYPDEAVSMGAAARRAVLADWTWERQAPHVAAMWREVLG